jgi:cytosine/adenosine deaminase-related metal-dependent hydrolase
MTDSTMLVKGANLILDGDGSVRSGPVDILVQDGRIAAIGPVVAAPAGATVIQATGHLVAPGFVNAHWHSPMQFSPGTADRMNHKAFMWLNQVDTARRTSDEIYVSAVIGCLQMQQNGITSVLDHFPEQHFGIDDIAAVVRAYRDTGMRAVVALRIFDGPYADIVPPPERTSATLAAALARDNPLAPRPMQESLDLCEEAIARFDQRQGMLRIFPAPSNPVRCSDAMLVACQKMAERHDTGIHCHLLETRVQAEIAEARYGRSMVAQLDAIGALSDRLSCAHCNWLTPDDIGLMAARGAIAVLNPESNLKIGSGVPPIPDLLAAGVTCALGTDGVSTNDNLVMQDAMMLATIAHRPGEAERSRWATVADAMRMATTGGAAAMRADGLGLLRPGQQADLVLYDLDDWSWVPLNDAGQQMVFSERGRAVRTVIVAGQLVMQDGRHVRIDRHAILAEARAILGRVRARNGAISAIAEMVDAVS